MDMVDELHQLEYCLTLPRFSPFIVMQKWQCRYGFDSNASLMGFRNTGVHFDLCRLAQNPNLSALK
jgi:hypothetical protein